MSGFSTRAIRIATRPPKVSQQASAVPTYQAATFNASDAAEFGAVLTGAIPGYAYSRIDNPTTAVLAAAIAELEGAEHGLSFAIRPGVLRVSVGLEDCEDLRADFANGLEAAGRIAPAPATVDAG